MSTRDVDPDADQEVDLGRYWSAIVARWWLPLLGLIVGVIVGYLISLGGKQVWNASSTVYLGASYSIIGGNLLQGPQANPATVGTMVLVSRLTRDRRPPHADRFMVRLHTPEAKTLSFAATF